MTTSIYTNKKSLEYRRITFKSKAELIHNFRYTYPFIEEEYSNTHTNISIECEIHGIFPQPPNSHLRGQGCPKCGIIKNTTDKFSNIQDFSKKANIVHNYRYGYDFGIYEGSSKNIDIECYDHGIFLATPNNHLNGRGCPFCTSKRYSKIAIKWLDSLNLPNIIHAENIGEFNIPNTKYRVDGYNSITNTVYEFHGDDWHGNPDKHKSNTHCHPFDKEVTAGELYQNTIDRENEIKDLGYNLVVMWESDYNKSK